MVATRRSSRYKQDKGEQEQVKASSKIHNCSSEEARISLQKSSGSLKASRCGGLRIMYSRSTLSLRMAYGSDWLQMLGASQEA